MKLHKLVRPRGNALAVLLTAGLVIAQPIHGAGTPGADDDELTAEGLSIDEAAVAWYSEGLAHKEAAREKEDRAATAGSAEEREQLLADAQADYRAAVAAQGKALKLHLDYYQAANELGYALRQTGDYRKALGAYNFALEIKPDFYPAVEYRGEAYLALGMLEASREAYMTLFRNDLALARRLLQAMEAYAPRVDDPAFADWVAERKQLAALLPTSAPEAGDW
jgi:tetratricopeptide (TPR) repeat protein